MDRPTDLLTQGAVALAASDDLDTVAGRLLGIVAAELGADFGAVTLQDPDRAGLQVAVTFGADEARRAAFEAEVARPGNPVADVAADRAPRMDEGSVHVALVVTRGGIDQLVGVLSLARPAEVVTTDEERAIVPAFADLIAVAIDRARTSSLVAERSEWYERMAHTDLLTGLANQRTFGRVLELELARAARQGSEVSIAIFDVDGFGAANDAAGHEVGDDILRSVAAVVAESVRLVDTVARSGGDEFILVAPGAAGMTVARRVIDGVAALPAIGGRRVTVSGGVARFPADGATSEELLAAAAEALVAARAGGQGGLAAASAPAAEG